MEKHLLMRKDIALMGVCLVKYPLSVPFDVQQIDVFSDFRYKDQIHHFRKHFFENLTWNDGSESVSIPFL